MSLRTNLNLRHSWYPNGKMLAFQYDDPRSRRDIWILSLEGQRKPQPLLQTPADQRPGGFSPDGRWVTYVSDESGRFEVYVQAFPGPGGKWQVSTEGGSQPVWAGNGREIFYRSGDKMMSVGVETGSSLRLSKPEILFEGRYEGADAKFGYAKYDITRDGQRFVMVSSEQEAAPTRIHVILNWAEELKQRVPSNN